MIYLDYSATTPVLLEVLDSYIKVTKDYIGNPNSLHKLGINAKELYESAKKQISELLQVMESEIIFTSGATEANNMALIGTAIANHKKGNHIIVSMLEHPSIYKMCEYLETLGFKISYVKNTPEGLIDMDDLKRLIKPETILVSICAVNSELGIRQPLKSIRQVIKKENLNTYLHSDITQALGKVGIYLHDVDLASASGHKIYAPKGIGFLYKNSKVAMAPIIHGSSKNNERPGTIPLPLVVSLSKAMRIALTDIEKREAYVKRLNDKIVNHLKKYEDVLINSTKYGIAQILNISVLNIKPETFIHALEEHEVYIGSNTACATNDISTSVMAIYNDKKRAMQTLRISLSYLTTVDEVNKFLNFFDEVYNKLVKLS